MDEIFANKLAQAIGERNELADAIRQTLTENAHLTDGEICTLKRLKDVLLKVDESIQENKKVEIMYFFFFPPMVRSPAT